MPQLANAVPGRAVQSAFRDYGNVLRLTKDRYWGQARAGLWVDYDAGNAYRTEIAVRRRGEPHQDRHRDGLRLSV